jgi:hypothetical protein
MKFIADGKVPKFRKGVHSGHNSRMVIALAIREIKVGKVRDGSGQIGVLPY